jgi:hypothetical protein
MSASRSRRGDGWSGCSTIFGFVIAMNALRGLSRLRFPDAETTDLLVTVLLVLGIVVVVVVPGIYLSRRPQRRQVPTLPPSQHPLFDRQLDQYPR